MSDNGGLRFGAFAVAAKATEAFGRKVRCMSEMGFNTFVFDLDGTLLDTLPDLVVVTNRALAEMGFPPRTTEEIHSFVGNGLMALMYQAIPEGAPKSAAEEAMDHWKALFPTYHNDLTRPYPGMPEALASLKAHGARLGVLSNKFDAGVQQVMNQFMPGVFDVIHGECEGIPRKPDPTGLLRTIDELGAIPSSTVYVGDSPTDIAVAQRAGVFSVGVSWGYHHADELRTAHAQAVIKDPRELIALLGRQRRRG